MIKRTKIIRTHTFDPWWNLSAEEYLLDRVGKNEAILYLWQNQNTVVIGKNQNAWRECRTEMFEKEGGKLARRLSGGGAVFHDLGNLNFTFLVNREDYDLERQVKVILSAVKKIGIQAEMTGRNDITANGRKFSGNAFCFRKTTAYHHGTILISADFSKLSNYLQVSKEKILSKGIQSVQSRVVNLIELNPSLTVDAMANAMMEAFEESYGGSPEIIENMDWADQDILKQLYEKYSSWDWRYGEAPKFDIEFATRFMWGGVEIGLKLVNGKVNSIKVYSDALDEEFIGMLPKALQGCAFKSADLAARIRSINAGDERNQMICDIAAWVEEKGF